MKKLLTIITSLLMLVMLAAGCGNDGPKKMVIGLDDNFAPMGYRNEKNEIVGMDIDLAREACKRLKLEVEFKPIDWGAKEAELKSKRIDAIWNCFTANPDRAKVYGLSKPYIRNSQLVVVEKDSPINKIADLKGKIVAVQDDSTGAYLLELPKNKELTASLKEVRKYPDFATIYLELDNRRIDAMIVDAVLARGYYDKLKPGQYKILDESMGDEVVVVAFRKDDKDFLGRIDKVMDEMKKDGTCKKISEKWMGVDITYYE